MSALSVEPPASVERSESARSALVDDDSKRTPDNSVPNVVITCTADDDLQSAPNALQMIDAFNLPTADEVKLCHRCNKRLDINLKKNV